MKKGWKIFLSIIIALIIIVLALGIYFYYFFVFKTIRICIPQESESTNTSCSSSQQCLDLVYSDVSSALSSIPPLIKDKVMETFNYSIYCESTCKIKRFYYGSSGGVPLKIFSELTSCKPREKEITLDIKGKEAIQLLSYIKQQGAL